MRLDNYVFKQEAIETLKVLVCAETEHMMVNGTWAS